MDKPRYHLVRNRLSRLSSLQLLTLASLCINKMKDNPLFPNPTPGMVELEEAKEEFNERYKLACNGDRLAISRRNTQEAHLRLMMLQLTAYVQAISNGDKNIIFASGMECRNPSSTPEIPSAPTGVYVKRTAKEDTLQVTCKRDKNIRTWTFEWTDQDPAIEKNWTQSVTLTTCKATISGLVPYIPYTFRVKAMSAGGTSNFSSSIQAIPA